MSYPLAPPTPGCQSMTVSACGSAVVAGRRIVSMDAASRGIGATRNVLRDSLRGRVGVGGHRHGERVAEVAGELDPRVAYWGRYSGSGPVITPSPPMGQWIVMRLTAHKGGWRPVTARVRGGISPHFPAGTHFAGLRKGPQTPNTIPVDPQDVRPAEEAGDQGWAR